MTATMTPWGYTADIDSDEAKILTVGELTARTGASDSRAATMIDAVSAAVRDYCRWHVMPALSCEYTCDGDGRLIKLPAKYVSAVESITVDGVELAQSEWRLMSAGRSGCIETKASFTSWQTIVVRYTAGYDNAEMLKQAIANATAGALVTPHGVTEEHAGNVGMTYANTGDASFVPSDRLLRVLSRYRIESGV